MTGVDGDATHPATPAADHERLRAKVKDMRALLERAHSAFAYMAALHGAYPDATVTEVRDEVNAALSTYWHDLEVILDRAGDQPDRNQP